MKQLLGIDIDGVFNIVSVGNIDDNLSKTSIFYLNKILETLPNCDVLITSSWGNLNNSTVDTLVKFGFKYPDRVVGNTGFINCRYSRTHEIKGWLSNIKNINKYDVKVYLDDEIELFDHFTEGASRYNVVLCRPDIGLNIDKAYETVCRLQGINFKFWSQ